MAIHMLFSQGTRKIRLAPVPKTTVQPSTFVMTTCGGHDDNVSTETKKRKIMNIVIFEANGATGKILMKQAHGKIETS